MFYKYNCRSIHTSLLETGISDPNVLIQTEILGCVHIPSYCIDRSLYLSDLKR